MYIYYLHFLMSNISIYIFFNILDFSEDLYPRYSRKWNLRLLVYQSVCLSVKCYPKGREVTLPCACRSTLLIALSCKAAPLIARSSPFSLFNLQVENESRLGEVEKEEEEVVKEEEKEEFFICAIVPLLHNSSIII